MRVEHIGDAVVSGVHRGVRDWSVKARRNGESVVVIIKVGRMEHSRVNLSMMTWPDNLYDQRRTAAKALGEAIDMPEMEWTSPELDRIPDEIVGAVNELMVLSAREIT